MDVQSPATVLTLLFAAALLGSLALRYWLAGRQLRHVAGNRAQVPAEFAGTVGLAAHQKAADYTIAKGRFGLLATAWGAAVLVGWTLLGGLGLLNDVLREALQPRLGDMGYQLALFAAFAVVGGVLDLPLELYSTFRIEQRFGFNRMTWRLFVLDLVKGVAVGVVVGAPIAALILWLMASAGRTPKAV